MPIKIPNELPAVETLTEENIFVITETRAITQDIRPLKILVLNLMPKKIATETQLSRILGNTPLQIELELIMTASHVPTHISAEHLLAFYKTFDDVKGGFVSIAKLAKMDIVPIAICNFRGYNIIPFKEHVVLKIGKPISYQLPEEEILKQWKEYGWDDTQML